ncbi:MAG: hypothetical protein A3D65_06185 [Candidatus Lloydbacteria bacterium RIFCSPHIGHO2_02_FULL_50_13]|uniref:Uncharacterized protein n=1 Tax=Candidatus Lloydbacteria bacterium RIFCSPHIGHO2_02_FULL_50_13 TaxID=1798661 RepID=A0A1G2D523_9BACT|nr:MAG: hypothetical protein A3D65_06185 [Candidatus Lloydbacteria bacterium RIFCSPHIGHO2_02_FULL_50_13]
MRFFGIQTIIFTHDQHKRYWISEFSKIEILLPPLKEQIKIVKKVDKLLSKVDEAKKMNTEIAYELKALSASILNKAFKKEEKIL